MPEATTKTVVKVEFDDKQLKAGGKTLGTVTRKTAEADKKLAKYNKTLDRVKTAAKGFAIALAAGIGFSAKAVQAYKAQEQAQARLANALRATGRAIPQKEIEKLAATIQKNGIFGDEAIIDASAMLATFTTISDEAMPRAMQVAADLAAQFQISLDSAAKLVGKASMGMTGDLSRVGITLSDAAKESKDFNLILADMEGQSKGANAELGKTATGGLTQLSMAWGDFMEIVGKGVAETLKPATEAFTGLITRINEVLTQSDFEKNEQHLAAVKKELEHVLTLSQADYTNDRFQTWESDVRRLREEIELLTGAMQADEFTGSVEGNAAAQAAFDRANKPKEEKKEDVKTGKKGPTPISTKAAEDFANAMALRAEIEEKLRLAKHEEDIAKQEQMAKDLAAASTAAYLAEKAIQEENAKVAEDARLAEEKERQREAREADAAEQFEFEFGEEQKLMEMYAAFGLSKLDLDMIQNDKQLEQLKTYLKERKKTAEAEEKEELKNKENFFSDMAGLQTHGNKKIAAIGKAFAVAKLAQSIAVDAPLAFAKTSSAYPAPLGPILGGIHAAGIVASGVSALGKFESGGIVPGSPSFDDSTLVRANPAEVILSKSQQRNLAEQVDGGREVHGTLKVKVEGDGKLADVVREAVDESAAIGEGREY